MTVMLNVPPDRLAALRDGIARHDAEALGNILLESPHPIIDEVADEDLTGDPDRPQTMEEYYLWMAELDAYLGTIIGPDVPQLSDYAVSREGIYADHP